MFNLTSFFSKFIKSNNQRELDKVSEIVKEINSLENKIQNLKDSEFPQKTLEFKEEIKKGKNLDLIMPKAFALVREASKRVRN